MSTEYKPGDVAMVTAYNRTEPYRAYFDGKTWREHGHDAFCVDAPTSIEPLLVLRLLFPDDFVKGLRDASLPDGYKFVGQLHAADQIEEQMWERRLPEPGVWAVVKAQAKGTGGRSEHVNVGAGWQSVSDGAVRTWETLQNPTLIRKGVK